MLSGCGGSDPVVITDPPEPPRPTAAPQVNQAKAFDGPLTQAGEINVSRFIRNGIYSATLSAPALEAGDGVSTPVSTPTFASDNFSTTNTQEQGVDEADRVEYDGSVMYLASYPQWFDEENRASIRVLQRNDDFSLTQLDELFMSEQNRNIDGLYLADKRLAAIGSNNAFYSLVDIAIAPWEESEGKVNISIFDTEDTSDISLLSDIQIDGSLMSSRRIEQQLFVVTTYVPRVRELEPGEVDDATKLRNYLRIIDTPMSEIMPQISHNGVSQPLNQPEECLIPEDAQANDGFAQLITVTKIDLDQPQNTQSLCMSAFAFMLYMSEQNMYVASNIDQDTGFHKISLNDLRYQAFGTVTGQIGWRGTPQLRVDEEQEYFRVLSTDYSEQDPVHGLTVLQQQGEILQVVAQLPNEANPEPIGKPREDVYAVRFIGDKGYVVTFEQIDPLYVLDFSQPDAPVIAGSLEIPGFSSYLHPLENGYLLGIGQQVNPRDIPGTGTEPVQPPVAEGMKISLFDVNDPAAPVELASIVKERAYTPVEFDYRALSVLNLQGSYQFALPMEEWGVSNTGGGPQETSLWAARSSLLLLETDTTASTVALMEIDQMIANNTDSHYVYSGNDRSIIHGEHVYYINGNNVWHGLWQQDNELDGPY